MDSSVPRTWTHLALPSPLFVVSSATTSTPCHRVNGCRVRLSSADTAAAPLPAVNPDRWSPSRFDEQLHYQRHLPLRVRRCHRLESSPRPPSSLSPTSTLESPGQPPNLETPAMLKLPATGPVFEHLARPLQSFRPLKPISAPPCHVFPNPRRTVATTLPWASSALGHSTLILNPSYMAERHRLSDLCQSRSTGRQELHRIGSSPPGSAIHRRRILAAQIHFAERPPS